MTACDLQLQAVTSEDNPFCFHAKLPEDVRQLSAKEAVRTLTLDISLVLNLIQTLRQS